MTHFVMERRNGETKETPLHADIERNLIDAYNRHLMSLDASVHRTG
jgi:hypothetical protein